eukprot:gb/GECH01013491.1/.p1 GENE.gb/GECH01013491.1/~~gb/GECH01013491.1/.p1  ORF type:complete len:1089 (+),score=243.03 gb/GECH01013491.1/:1-3267(+)
MEISDMTSDSSTDEASPFLDDSQKTMSLNDSPSRTWKDVLLPWKKNNSKNETEEEEAPDDPIPSIFGKIFDFLLRRKRYFSRTVSLQGNARPDVKFPPNRVKNTKYNVITFVPLVLYEQFKFFFNLYFLIVALSQFIPALKVGFLFTYVAPLVFVLIVTMIKEAFDDIKRAYRDREANRERYRRLTRDGYEDVFSANLKVGDLVQVEVNQRVPADCILLRTTEETGASFIRTDQLDGETDWKLRRTVPSTQKVDDDRELLDIDAWVYAERPRRDIYNFVGTFTRQLEDGGSQVESLSLENTIWSNTVVASGNIIGLIVYTGRETRAVMNASSPSSKVGKIDNEINLLSKLLFALMCVMSFVMVAIPLFPGQWYIRMFRFLLLFSSIIPISMRVNLDIGKAVYSFLIMRDKKIPGTVVRNSSIPEELGRINYLFSDKTGTLTQNEMIFKKLQCDASMSFSGDTLSDIYEYLRMSYKNTKEGRRMKQARTVHRIISALALCHNVTPVIEDGRHAYQASSPDEVALVKFTEEVGMVLQERTLNTMTIKTPVDTEEHYKILKMFPFRSETKRMGIIVKNTETERIFFYMKGADVVMSKIVKPSNWLGEKCDDLARDGLRTLVFGYKELSPEEFDDFEERHEAAKAEISQREQKVQAVVESLEEGLDLLGLTGVEDLLQEDVQTSLEDLRNAAIKTWMLTGDKVETAKCIARSTRLVSRNQEIFSCIVKTETDARERLAEFDQMVGINGAALIIDGSSLQLCLDHLKSEFIEAACKAPAVVCCRCSPTQKALVVQAVKKQIKLQTAAIGDGGNDVSMIQAADCGLGIVGKEGKQAAMAADFSITQFSYITRLILWHGRNSYKRSARLSQFVIHRGLIISVIQALFSAIYYFAAIPIYTGWLLVGYSTYYTCAPVFSIVSDEDVTEDVAFNYPQLYTELQKGRSLSYKTFIVWIFKGVYQGGVIMLLAILLFENSFIRIVSITFTALILTELIMVACEVHKLNLFILLAELVSIAMYFCSVLLLPTYFDIPFVFSWGFWWRTILLTVASLAPVYVVQFIEKKLFPPPYAKLQSSYGMKQRIKRWCCWQSTEQLL